MAGPTNALTYNAYVTQVGTLAVLDISTVGSIAQTSDTAFNAMIPGMLNYAELRIQRDLDLLPLQTSSSYTFISGDNLLSIPVADFVTVQSLSVSGVPLTPVSKEFLQNVYGSNAVTGQPVYFAPYGGDKATAGNTSTILLVGPFPDSNYPVSVTGTQRMPSLALNATAPLAGSATTFISAWLPDLLIQASMIYAAQFQRNFSPTGSDPQMPLSYETVYQGLLRGAQVEEARKRFAASAWSSMAPPVVASPSR